MTSLRACVLLLVATTTLSLGCTSGEGERCNPNRTTDECASGLICTTPSNCPQSVCCPVDGTSRDPACAACAVDDAGPTDTGSTSPDADDADATNDATND